MKFNQKLKRVEIPNDTIEKYLYVFKEIFNKTQNSGHYSMMMKEELLNLRI